MTEWRPLGVDTEEQISAFDALHDGVPEWISDALWMWIRNAISETRRSGNGYGTYLNQNLTEAMCQILRIPLPALHPNHRYREDINHALKQIRLHGDPLQVIDYLLCHKKNVDATGLVEVLTRGKSAWNVGERNGFPGLIRRVPIGVQDGFETVSARAGRAGLRLADAWQHLFGVIPNPSAAYATAIKAIEDAAIPVVSPSSTRATLGTVISDMSNQDSWALPMERTHERAIPKDVLVSMMRLIWAGQYDRHGGQPSAPGSVTFDEARIAVTLAVPIVDWFNSGLISRNSGLDGSGKELCGEAEAN